MYKLTIRTGTYNTQLLVKRFGHRTKKKINKKAKIFNLQKTGRRMARLFGVTHKPRLCIPWA